MTINLNKFILSGMVGASALAASLVIVPFEGNSLTAYFDPPHVATICRGHTKGVTINMKATDAQCAVFLGQDIGESAAVVARLVEVKISDETRAAFISYVFNAGAGNFSRSTMLRKINAGDIRGACNQLPRWVYANGKKLAGLVRRRAAEQALCLKGI